MSHGTKYYSCIRANDNAGNGTAWVCSNGFTIDTAPPTNPSWSNIFDLSTSLVDAAWSTSATLLGASWNAGSGTVSGVRDYDVCFSSVGSGCTSIAGTTIQAGNTTRTATATASGMTHGNRYFVCVRAWDNAGNVAASWTCSNGFVVDTVAPAAPAAAHIYDLSTTFSADQSLTSSATALSASWDVGSDTTSSVQDYDVCFSSINDGCISITGTVVQAGNTTRTAVATASSMSSGATYYTCVRSRDNAGNVSAWSCSNGFLVDAESPTQPGSPIVVAQNGQIAATWPAVVDATAVTYNIALICDTIPFTQFLVSAPAFTQAGIADGSQCTITVTARDAAGNVSTPTSFSTIVIDTIAPSAPTGLDATSVAGTISASWTPVIDSDLDHYVVTVTCGATVMQQTSTSSQAEFTGITDDAVCTIDVAAVDRSSNASLPATTVAVYQDIIAPDAPTAVTVLGLDNALSISWNPSAANDVIGYRVRVMGNGMDVMTPTQQSTTYLLSGLSDNVAYHVEVTALDGANNSSVPGGAVGTPVDHIAPDAPLKVKTSLNSSSSVALAWNVNADDVVRYDVSYKRKGQRVLRVRSTRFKSMKVTGLVSGARYVFQVQAIDDTGHRSAARSTGWLTVR